MSSEEEARQKAQKDWRETSEYQNPYKSGTLESLAYNAEFSKCADIFNCGSYNYGA